MSSLIDESWSRYIWTCIGNSDKDSKCEHEDSAQAPGTMPALESMNISLDPPAAPRILGLEFERFHKDHLDVAEVTNNVFKLMKEPLKESKSPAQGYIYALSIKGHPGYVKIGRTGVSIASRRKAIEKCVSYELQVYDNNDFHRIPNYQILEKLIHEELRNERQKFSCRCGRKTTDSDCLTAHGEWFAISPIKASEVINRWRKWISSGPYTEGILRHTEQLKIDYYNGCAAFQWTDFVEFPRWKLLYIWLSDELHRSRPGKPGCSRWDSLCKHWKSNLTFYVACFIFSYNLFIISAILPSTLISIRFFAFANSIFLGVSAILFAA